MAEVQEQPPRQVVGVVRESLAGETRVAATPPTVAQLIDLGYEVVVEAGAGAPDATSAAHARSASSSSLVLYSG